MTSPRLVTLVAALAFAVVGGGCADSSNTMAEPTSTVPAPTSSPVDDAVPATGDPGSTAVTFAPTSCQASRRPDGRPSAVVGLGPQAPGGGLGVHESPDKASPIVATLAEGAQLATTSGDAGCVLTSNGIVWWKVTTDEGETGWADSSFLTSPGAG